MANFTLKANKPPKSVHVAATGKRVMLVVVTAENNIKELPISKKVANVLVSNGMRLEENKAAA